MGYHKLPTTQFLGIIEDTEKKEKENLCSGMMSENYPSLEKDVGINH